MNRREFVAGAASGALALAFTPRTLAARLGGTPVALVTADLESHVAVVELPTGRVLERIRTAPGPRSIESFWQRLAVVGHTEHGIVTVLDAFTYSARAELDAFEAPRYTAFHPSAAIAYVTDSAAEEVVTLDALRGRILARTRVPGPARHLGISLDGRTLWTSLGTAAARIAVLDAGNPKRPRLERTLEAPFLAHDVVFAPDGRTVWVTSGSERRIALFRRGRRPERILGSGTPPQHVTFARDKAFVACGDDGAVYRHRLDGDRLRHTSVSLGSYNITFGWGRVVTPSLGNGIVTVLDRNGRLRARRRVARAAHDACIAFGP
jgi:hypothetical protein